MARFILAVFVGLVGAGLVHIAIVFLIPQVAENSAWSRLSAMGGVYRVVRIAPDRESPSGPLIANAPDSAFAFADPAFVVASCRFALDEGPVEITANGTIDSFWSASIYDRQGDNIYSINDRAAINGLVDLIIGTPGQVDEVRTTSLLDDGSAIPVVVDIREGYVTVRVLIDEPSKAAAADSFLDSISCVPLEIGPTA